MTVLAWFVDACKGPVTLDYPVVWFFAVGFVCTSIAYQCGLIRGRAQGDTGAVRRSAETLGLVR